jgi:asparagine synthase (glutamine-hydrolysing)
MCGIAGILNVTADRLVAADELRLMSAPLSHRGPDDAGEYVDPRGRCGLAFRRLSIIDLAGGHQPISNEDGTIWLVFNGEIYNYRSLREELLAAGHQFRTEADSEVIVHLYEEYGAAAVTRLAGMFAIALWDERRGQLLLARDRLGKKPLVYAEFDGRLYFGSEFKAILALPGIPRVIDPQSLHRYLVFQYVPAPHAIYRGFHKLPPAHQLVVSSRVSAPPTPQAYWHLDPPPFAGDYRAALTRLDELLTDAVRKRLIADVPLGAFLSGGIDSAIVVALMRKLGVSPLRTFTIGFADPRYDERAAARQVAEQFQTEHHEHVVTPEAREILATLAYHYDEPFADSSAIPTYYVSRWARTAVTVALTGDGGDECFGGYDRYRAAQAAARLDVLPLALRRLLARAATRLPHTQPRTLTNRLYRFLSPLPRSVPARYLEWTCVFSPEILSAAYQPEFRAQLDLDEPARWCEWLQRAVGLQPAARAMQSDIHSYLPYDLLAKVDLASMACGLECRAPLLDHELVEFAFSLPLKWRAGATSAKRILRDWACAHLPARVLKRPKMGFGVPLGAWFRGELQQDLRDRVLAADSLSRRIFEPRWLETLVAAHCSGQANHEHRLWALLMLELWADRWQPTLGIE